MSTSAAKVALDLSRFDTQPRARDTTLGSDVPAIRALPVPQVRVAAESHARLIIRGALIFLCVSILCFLIINSYMRIAEMNQTSREILSEINQLKKEETLLLQERDSLISASEVDRIAEEELGMVRPSEGQIIYIDLSGEDHAEVIGE